MTKLYQSREEACRADGGRNAAPSTCRGHRLIVAVLLVVASLGGCSGKKRDFATGTEVTASAPGESSGAAGAPGAGGPEEAQPCEGDCDSPLDNDTLTPENGVDPTFAGEAVFLLASVGEPCTTGSTACDGDEQRLACEDGVFVAAEPCTSVCREVNGAAGCTGACSPGQRGCSDTGAPELCDAEGVWRPDAPCPVDAPVCQGGDCVACEAGSTRCNAEGSPETCDAAGVWIAGAACAGTTPLCVPELGACGECSPGAARACVEEQGNCAQGTQTCQADGTWGACSIQPAAADSCDPGDDATCDGTPNQGCGCTADTACGPAAVGLCQPGVSACINGEPGACLGAQQPQARDCTSPFDNDCDGTLDNARDAVCQCTPGTSETCDTHPGLDGIGVCRAGTRTCVASAGNVQTAFGQCVGSVGPRARDCRSAQDNDCDGAPDNRIDGACQCVPGETRDCGAEPGADGCARGTQTCQLSADGSRSSFGGCVLANAPQGTACDDGDAQTVGDVCQAGACAGIRAGILATGSGGSCAIRSGGDVYCWGDSMISASSSNVPTRIDLPLPAVSVSVGFLHACAVLTDESLRCWGSNQQGVLGNGMLDPAVSTARPDLANVVQVATSSVQTAALTADGAVFLWGAANAQRVATNISLYGPEAPPESTSNVPTPFPIARLGQVTSVALGQVHMCAALGSGQVVCWGRNGEGQLGRPPNGGVGGLQDVSSAALLVDLPGTGDDAAAAAAGSSIGCTVRRSGQVACWGQMSGPEIVSPSEVSGLSGALQVSAGGRSACALRNNGTVACWGSNLSGQLGTGSFVESTSAQPVANLTDAVLLGATSSEASSFCALRNAGQVVCWGGNSFGQLGDGTTTNRPTPVPVLGLPD